MYNLSYLPELEINYGALNVWLGQIFPKILIIFCLNRTNSKNQKKFQIV